MRWNEIDTMTCSIVRTLSVVGDRWTMLIIRDVLLGIRRFDAMQRDLGLTPHRLSDRLRKLVHEGILVRVMYEKHPRRFEYRLTEKGIDLCPRSNSARSPFALPQSLLGNHKHLFRALDTLSPRRMDGRGDE